MNLDASIHATAEAAVEYGPLTRRVAAWAGIEPADVTADHVGRFEAAHREAGTPQCP